MARKHHIIVTILIASLVFSCETTEKIDDFPLRPSRMVANCFFSSGSTWTFQISKSLSVLDNAELQLVKDAKIVIMNGGKVIDTIKGADPVNQLYHSDLELPVAGETYSIEVISPGFKNSLFAEDVLPDSVPITDVSITIIDSTFYYDPYADFSYGNVNGIFNVSFRDPPDEENYYQISVYGYYQYYDYMDSTYFEEKRPISFNTGDPVADNDDSFRTNLLFSDDIFNGQNYQLKLDFEDWDASRKSTYEIELMSISRAGYLYRRTVKEYQNSSEDPFSEPVLIYSNIENGYGIFAGQSTNRYIVKLFE
ncbi:MAG: DUF4249 domain-containing protein [Bacteroidales bacterium]|nr:DUF4249 domain-containing protein [Bacteroidales bacterium]